MRVSIYLVTKRGIDLFGAVSLIIILSPILLVLSILVKLTSKGPVIHWSKRVGRDNEVFLMAKFRTMKIETPQIATHLMSDPDSYLTSIGGYFRRKSLDELPQLVNILKGEISFVGPRPALFNQEDLIEARTKVKVHSIRPGITGWAQIHGRDEIPIPQKVEYDNYYLENRSLFLDFRILLETFFKVIREDGVSH
ncbi:sugar transferase [Pseudomonadales bacterium]|mgnify:FL=1|nr:sugar transferase [Pseudomonadales bacterium]